MVVPNLKLSGRCIDSILITSAPIPPRYAVQNGPDHIFDRSHILIPSIGSFDTASSSTNMRLDNTSLPEPYQFLFFIAQQLTVDFQIMLAQMGGWPFYLPGSP